MTVIPPQFLLTSEDLDARSAPTRAMAPGEAALPRPKVVVLCGSSRFIEVMAVCAWLLEKQEQAITLGLHLLPGWYSTKRVPHHLAEEEGVHEAMDRLHLCKIDIADEVFVVNCNHYVGSSTQNEVTYAMALKKHIRWFTHDPLGLQVEALIQEAASTLLP